MGTKLTGKQRKLVQGIAKGKTLRDASKDAGLNESYASTALRQPKIRATLQELMEKTGLGDKSLLAVHRQMLGASRTVSAISGKDANAGTVDFIDVPDWQARGKALEMGYKLKGAFVEKHEVSGPGGGPVMFRVFFDSPKEKS